MDFKEKSKIMDKEALERTIKRMAHEILEKNRATDNFAIIGIRKRGAILAQRLVETIAVTERQRPLLGILDITLYRDDLTAIGAHPVVRSTEIDFDTTGKTIVLVDDVLYTGRTIRCALDALIDFGRPKGIQLAVLIDRGHRELPIRPDYIGKNMPTSIREVVHVHFVESDGEDAVLLREMVNEDKMA